MPSAVIGPSARAISAKQLRWALAHTKKLRWARKRASQPSGRTPHCALPACLPSYADYILRLDTEPESLEIMLRLLIVALPLVFALPAAFDNQETNAIQFEVQSTLQFEVQSTLQFEVRSPPESRPLLPREINTTPLCDTRHSARTTPKRTHHHARDAALERGPDDPPPRSTTGNNLFESQGTPTHHPARPAATHAVQAAFGRPSAARARERERDNGTHAAGAHTRHARRPLPRLLQRRARREARRLVNSQPPLARKLSAHSQLQGPCPS